MEENQFLTYRGYPLVRSKNVIYYGNMTDRYIIRLTVLSEEKHREKIRVELLLSDTGLSEKERISKTSEKIGFYEAMDLAGIWLARFNKE